MLPKSNDFYGSPLTQTATKLSQSLISSDFSFAEKDRHTDTQTDVIKRNIASTSVTDKHSISQDTIQAHGMEMIPTVTRLA